MWGFFGAKRKRVYLDHASATPVLPEAVRAVADTMALFGNPGATHAEAVVAKQSLQESRESIAHELGCKAREIIFTSGLTEANNLAISGRARAIAMDRHVQGLPLDKTHWVVSSIEHDSVLEAFSDVERQGGEVTHVDPDERGIILGDTLAHALRPETVMVSVGWGNNEIGTIQPLKEIAHAIRDHEKKYGTMVLLHSDAGQAPLYRSPQVHTLGVDFFSLGSGKLYGPRGVAALYISNRVEGVSRLAPHMVGGGQERGLRAGTEDPALAAGFATALKIISRERDAESSRIKKIRDVFEKNILDRIPEAIINGETRYSLPHLLNVSLPEIDAEYLTLVLDRAGIAMSTKSACNEGDKTSHVVAALGRNRTGETLGGPEWRARNTLRFSLGRGTVSGDLDRAAVALVTALSRHTEKNH